MSVQSVAFVFFFSSRRRHTRLQGDWSSDVCSSDLAEAAAQGAGVALLPARMFQHLLQQGRLVRPFEQEVDTGAYWLTHLRSRAPSAALKTFRQWLLAQLQQPRTPAARPPGRPTLAPALSPAPLRP